MTAHNELATLIQKQYRERGEEISDTEADQAASNLVGYFDILYRVAMRIEKLNRRLKKEPSGFPVEGGYSCLVCGRSINPTNGWYHYGGQRCLTCHKAVQDGTIPAFVLWARDSFYDLWSLERSFDIKRPTALKLVKEGRLKARIVLSETGRPQEYLFLKKENPELVAREEWNPIRKSWNRHQDKVSTQQKRAIMAEMRHSAAV